MYGKYSVESLIVLGLCLMLESVYILDYCGVMFPTKSCYSVCLYSVTKFFSELLKPFQVLPGQLVQIP